MHAAMSRGRVAQNSSSIERTVFHAAQYRIRPPREPPIADRRIRIETLVGCAPWPATLIARQEVDKSDALFVTS